jgi:hypothetical protein
MASSLDSSSGFWPLRQSIVLVSSIPKIVCRFLQSPRPSSKMQRVFASRLCPDRIMQPHPVSDVKPCESISWLRRRTPSVIEDIASGVLFRGMGVKLERYVIHILDSKSFRNASGHVNPAGSVGVPARAELEAVSCLSGRISVAPLGPRRYRAFRSITYRVGRGQRAGDEGYTFGPGTRSRPLAPCHS